MTLGDRVVYPLDPMLYGVGVIDHILKNGRIVVMYEHDDGTTDDEEFDAQELELESVWQKRLDKLLTETIPAAAA